MILCASRIVYILLVYMSYYFSCYLVFDAGHFTYHGAYITRKLGNIFTHFIVLLILASSQIQYCHFLPLNSYLERAPAVDERDSRTAAPPGLSMGKE